MLSPNTLTSRNTRIAFGTDNLSAGSNSDTDSALLQKITLRDQLAMRTLFARHRGQAFRFILRLTKDEALAEDILIETFFEVWRSADKFEGRSAFSTWLLAVARNKTAVALRRRALVELDEDWAEQIPDPADGPEVVLQGKDLSKTLQYCLMGLSAKHTEVIDLVYYHEKTIAEVAQILRLPEATVKTRMFYARRKLAELVRAKLHDAST